MRKGIVAAVLLAFVLFLPWKVVPFLKLARPDVAATPTVSPTDPGMIVPVAIKHGQTACTNHMVFGPDTRFVALTVQAKHPTGRIRVEATAPGYRAITHLPTGLGNDAQALAPLPPAPRDVDGGTLCLTNEGRHKVSFYGVDGHGRAGSPAVTTVDGKPDGAEISVTLLRSPSRSLWGQLGEVFDRVAAFRPIGGWFAALLFGVLFLAAPVARAVALGRAAADDDDRPAADAASPPPHPRGGW
jgi:hypothetical protein